MSDIIRSKLAQGVMIAVASALLGGLATGWISLPSSVKMLEAQAAMNRENANKLDGRVGVVEKEYYPRRDAEMSISTLRSEMRQGFDRIETLLLQHAEKD